MCVGEKNYIPHITFKEQKEREISAEVLLLYSQSKQFIQPVLDKFLRRF